MSDLNKRVKKIFNSKEIKYFFVHFFTPFYISLIPLLWTSVFLGVLGWFKDKENDGITLAGIVITVIIFLIMAFLLYISLIYTPKNQKALEKKLIQAEDYVHIYENLISKIKDNIEKSYEIQINNLNIYPVDTSW